MNTYNSFANARPLTEEQLYRYAPSIFATEAHHSRSERFAPIPTIEIVRGMIKEGFLPFKAAQSRTRIADKRDFTKHMIRFRKVDQARELQVGDNLFEIILVNGNDGSSAYKLDAGIFRIACLNGMVVKSSDFGNATVRHTGDAFSKVIDASYEVLKNAEAALAAPQDWSRIQLSDRQRRAFAVGAHVERFGEESTTIVQPEQLLIPRRQADTGRDLWSTFNVLQENAIRGGVHASGRDANNRFRRTTTREVQGIDQNVKVNKGLWAMASWLAENA